MPPPTETLVSQGSRPASGDSAWQWFKAGDWRWQLNPALARPEFLKRLEWPARLLESPTRLIKAQGSTGIPLVAEVELPEFPGFPLIIKRYLPRGLRQTAKVFFRQSSARKEFEIALLHGGSRLPAATVIAAGERRRGALLQETYLISALVPETQTLHEVNLRCSNRAQRVRIIRSFARSMAALHDAGFAHTDPSLTNFLVRESDSPSPQIYFIDLDGLKRRHPISERFVVKDLGRLFHRSHAVQQERLWFLAQYCRARIQRLSARDFGQKVRQAMLAAGYGHGLKANQQFGVKPHGGLHWQVRWPMVTPQVETILRAPDQFLEQAKVLKPSRSSAVGTAGGIVLKRYNYRKWLSRFKDSLRASRGRRAFQQAYRLESAGVPTARPIAAADRRRGGLPVRSYLVMEEIPGAVPLRSWNGNKRAACKQVADLLARLHNEGFTHRDLKGGNILFDATGRSYLIDLDGVRFFRCTTPQQAVADLTRLARDMNDWQHRLSGLDRVRFLVEYCRARSLPDWRWWWKEIAKHL